MLAKGIEPDKLTYSVIIDALCKEENIMEALKLRDEMLKKGIPLNLGTYESLIQALCDKEEFLEALKLLNEMGYGGFKPSLATCSIIASRFQRAGNMDKAVEVLERVMWFGWVLDSTSLSDLIDGNQKDANSENSDNLYSALLTIDVSSQVANLRLVRFVSTA
ncbi:hypothetical protein FEM48_Zijuj10G0089400 [Ziziphus jujuba var. spinosa]|uniref:Pentatricopeptide repeat-containing protein n=1 Tax=Ziziphus jujuba var. spinosa TaxID=714518 RepID=A0A978UMG1_ZIZJJ|nr:hypothetical protein FEM48_Zijuj10G0088900 [Ziziphus jujuba var. spinosa]KAH7516013.1 hypothetical protein FEM48_Zijuj10G0089400 [Ziziphus jujuba var. spinosa]